MLDEEAEKKALEDPFPVDFGATFVLCFCCYHLASLLPGHRCLDFKVCKEDWKDAGVTREAGKEA